MRRAPSLTVALSLVALGLACVPAPVAARVTAPPDSSQPGSSGGSPSAPSDPSAPPSDPGATNPPDGGSTPQDGSGSGQQQGPTDPNLQPASPDQPPGTTPSTPTTHRKHAISAEPVQSGPTVSGSVAQIRPSGKAVPPEKAPQSVKVMIWTSNRLIGLPYRYGGGHASFSDNSYDCSGALSYALHAADLLSAPEDSTLLKKWGQAGTGRWVTVYANRGHAFMIVAGIRLDTSPVGDPAGGSGPRWRPAARPTAHFRARQPASG